MKEPEYLSPKDAAPLLGLSVATITRCVKNGAPVHRWGSTGRRYRIDVDEFRRSNARASHPPRGEWIEILSLVMATLWPRSHPPRGEWIEIRG